MGKGCGVWMAEKDLVRFLDKVAQLQQLVQSIETNPERRDQLASCSNHNQVVGLAHRWGYDIGRRWGEPDALHHNPSNLFSTELPPTGEEVEHVLHQANNWKLLLIASNQASCPEGAWMSQVEQEWVMVLRGSAQLQLADPDRMVDLSVGDHLFLPAHCQHRVVRTDPDPGTLWLALLWEGPGDPSRIV